MKDIDTGVQSQSADEMEVGGRSIASLEKEQVEKETPVYRSRAALTLYAMYTAFLILHPVLITTAELTFDVLTRGVDLKSATKDYYANSPQCIASLKIVEDYLAGEVQDENIFLRAIYELTLDSIQRRGLFSAYPDSHCSGILSELGESRNIEMNQLSRVPDIYTESVLDSWYQARSGLLEYLPSTVENGVIGLSDVDIALNNGRVRLQIIDRNAVTLNVGRTKDPGQIFPVVDFHGNVLDRREEIIGIEIGEGAIDHTRMFGVVTGSGEFRLMNGGEIMSIGVGAFDVITPFTWNLIADGQSQMTEDNEQWLALLGQIGGSYLVEGDVFFRILIESNQGELYMLDMPGYLITQDFNLFRNLVQDVNQLVGGIKTAVAGDMHFVPANYNSADPYEYFRYSVVLDF